LESGEESDSLVDDTQNYGQFVTFSMPKNMVEYKWEVGTYFGDKAEFLDAIRTYGVHCGRRLKIQKNDKQRVRVTCLGAKGKCHWFAYCEYMTPIQT